MTQFDDALEQDAVAGRPVVRDKRRLDPVTGRLRETYGQSTQREGAVTAEAADGEVLAGELESLREQLAERTSDVQRVQAEYANYRRRVERDRELVRDLAVAGVLTELLPVLDDIGRAADHGELTGGFKSVSDALQAALGRAGLQSYGTAGEPFDPTVHEALTHGYSPEVTEPTAVAILMPGYKLGDRIVRAARVAVVEPPDEPAEDLAAMAADTPGEPGAGGGVEPEA